MEQPDPWISTDHSRGKARRTAFVRHPRVWLGRKLRPSRGISVVHPVPQTNDEVLERLIALPISTWTYGWDHDSVKHLGPMAQDFAGAFGLGDTDRMIDMVDAAGVAMAAV